MGGGFGELFVVKEWGDLMDLLVGGYLGCWIGWCGCIDVLDCVECVLVVVVVFVCILVVIVVGKY